MRVTRRSLLKSAPAFAGLATVTSSSATTASERSHSSFDPWVEVHNANLQHNVSEVRRRVSGRPILAVIKNNGYGLGIVNAANAFADQPGIAGLAVVKFQEAMTLRDAGVRAPILLMGPTSDTELAEAVAREVEPMVYTNIGPALDRIASDQQRKVPVHVCLDTGLGRIGVPYHQATPLVRDLAGRASVQIKSVMMTFTEDPEFDRVQLRRFTTFCSELREKGAKLGPLHAASSFALFEFADSFLDMVRPGMALFGVYPDAKFRGTGVLHLRPGLSLRARVIYVKRLRAGEGAGYNRKYVAERDVWVATLPVGHADGYPRDAVNGARVRIGGNLYPVIGTVSASHCIVEIGEKPTVKEGDVATFFDWQEGSRPEDISRDCGSSVYDLTMHLNSSLPRRMV